MLTKEELAEIRSLYDELPQNNMGDVKAAYDLTDYIPKLLDALEEVERESDKQWCIKNEWRTRAEEAEEFKLWMEQALKCEIAASIDEIKQRYNLFVQASNKISDDKDRYKARTEALERAAKGHCYCCENARPPKCVTHTGFPNMISCEHIKALATSGVSIRSCEHWQFDEDRFAEEKER